ncbi:neutral/alkaline ceramidase [Corynebacterium sp. TAE3-ERU12]|nr:neutral/alkaline ceramidase [Corynebacterium sp. TAE3-ERU12]
MNIGRGIGDVTGEPLGAGMNGYAVLKQTSTGIQRRQFARTFIFEDASGNRVAHITVDTGLMFQSVQQEVLRRLAARYGDLYHEGNTLITATHTHVAPGGTSGHAMVDLTTLGFRPVTFEAEVSGIIDSVARAHDDIAPSEMLLTIGDVEDTGRNRSFEAFSENPESDKALVPDGVLRTATTLHVLRNGGNIGLISWYGVHPTSFGPEFTEISGDSKGYAAWSMEYAAGVNHRELNDVPFVAAFQTGCAGDVTPNHGLAPGTGPGADQYESAHILGYRQAEGTKGSRISPAPNSGIDSRWKWVDMRNVQVEARFTDNGQPARTGPAVLGAAFAASSQEDGGGDDSLPFDEGARGGSPWVAQVNKVVVPPSAKAIHGNKEMLIPLGYIDGFIQQTHLFHITRIGGITLVSLGFEPTVVSGLRIRRTVAEVLDVDERTVIVQGYTSGYGHYIATPQEYDTQNYEGGATAFGRATLPAVMQIFDTLAAELADGLPNKPGRLHPDATALIPPSPAGNPSHDIPQPGHDFGDVITAPDEPVAQGEWVEVTFAAANPNSDLRKERGYVTVEAPDGSIIADDSHEFTRLVFDKDGLITNAVVSWNTAGSAPGDYVIHFDFAARDLTGRVTPFSASATVTVA